MNIVEARRVYDLAAGVRLSFLQKREGAIVLDGTTDEELLAVLIDRETKAFATLPSRETIRALYLLQEALRTFRLRTARRVDAGVEGTYQALTDMFKSPDAALDAIAPMGVDEIDYAPISRTRERPSGEQPDGLPITFRQVEPLLTGS